MGGAIPTDGHVDKGFITGAVEGPAIGGAAAKNTSRFQMDNAPFIGDGTTPGAAGTVRDQAIAHGQAGYFVGVGIIRIIPQHNRATL